jgi:pSer/pThr/pTyr-binding forkhead associated (FHA) protein
VVQGPTNLQGQVYDLIPGRSMVLGRDPGADLTIQSDRVSRRHCKFVPSPDGRYVLEDMGSANGTLVNQARINGRQGLNPGDYIQAGDCLFKFSPA